MQPNNSNPPQPFSDSSAPPMQSAPGAPPVGTSLPPASPVGASPQGAPSVDGVLEAGAPVSSLAQTRSRGANWFFWIVGLSVINALLIGFGSDRVLAIGTNATLLIDYVTKDEVAKHANIALTLRGVEFVLDALVLGFYAFCGVMAARGKVWAFYLGMAAFALDTVVSVLGADVLGGLIHAWALFTMWQGAAALKQLLALQKTAQTPASPWAA